jgi:two-component system, OmpR family, sensor histidine kinase KdpD
MVRLDFLRSIHWREYVASVALVAAVTLVGAITRSFVQPSTNLVMLYLLTVVFVALNWGPGPLVVASILSILSFRILFVPRVMPESQIDDYVTFVSVLLVGLVVSRLATIAREQAAAAQHRALQLETLYSLSSDLAAASDLEQVTRAVVSCVFDRFAGEAAILLPDGDTLAPRATTAGLVLDDDTLAAALWAYQNGQIAGRGTVTYLQASSLCVPLKASRRVVGVLAARLPQTPAATFAEQQRLVEAFASQAAMAIERAELAEAARQAYLYQATEKMQTALLNSISHDLRTPLASITGALTSLLDGDVSLDEPVRNGLVETAHQEANRLNHLVGNLLDMTRLEGGAMRPSCEPCDIQDLIGAALAQLGERRRGRDIRATVPDDAPMVPMDFVLMTQVLVNLLDNALKYSPPETPVEVNVHAVGAGVDITVADRGTGIPGAELEHIFDRFYRVQHPGHVSGTGLGLAISKGIVELHGGRIVAANRSGGGAVFTVTLPISEGQCVQEALP